MTPTSKEIKKYALVTGASRGIGKAIAIALSRDLGYHILLNFKQDEKSAISAQKEIKNEKITCELLRFNVANAGETNTVLNEWKTRNPMAQIEVLVNNAGLAKDSLFMWMPEEDWNTVLQTNLNGFFNVTQNLLKDMLLRRNGRIINMVSLAGLAGNAGQVNYATAKAGLIAATKSLSKEVAKRKVTVNAVAPGYIHSQMTENLPEDKLRSQIPLQRFGDPEEVAHLVSFLASSKAAYITGETININGGMYS